MLVSSFTGPLIVFAGLLVGNEAAISADEVKALPGWSKALPSKQWSGYIPVGKEKTRHLHYYFIASEGDPVNDPVTLWLNGGPGASSIAYGMATEIGQLVFNRDSMVDNSTNTPLLEYNQFSWSQHSSMLYIESPAGVGFSYCDYTPCASNDTTTAEDLYDAVTGFFAGFQEYSKLPFYISGESYAGIYCPMLAEQIMHKGGVNLEGLMVGNGCWGNQVGTCGFGYDEVRLEMEYQFGHSLFSQRLYAQIKTTCAFPVPVPHAWKAPPGCDDLITTLHAQAGSQFWDNPYTYNFCSIEGTTGHPAGALSEQAHMLRHGTTEAAVAAATPAAYYSRVAAATTAASSGESSAASGFESTGPLGIEQMWCNGPAAYRAWAALPEVIAALHVKVHDKAGAMQYTRAPAADLRPLYKTLAEKYRVLIYSGDSDGCVPHVGTEEWTTALGFPVTKDWRPWTTDRAGGNSTAAVVVGYTVQYGGDSKDFRFATVMGSGHEVPTFKPIPAYAMMTRFEANLPL